jgi:RNA recognition motif-containing protein
MDDSRKVLQVTNITHSATDADLADLFSVAGEVARTSIIQTGFPYYAFVEYYNPNDARRALNLNGKFFGPSKITVEIATQPFPQQPLLGTAPGLGLNSDPGFRRANQENHLRPFQGNQGNTNPNTNIVVQLNKPSNIAPENVTEVMLTNIPVSLKEHNLHQIFSEFGVVIDTVIIKDASGLTTGRGSISFASHESAVRAASTMDGKFLEGGHAKLLCQVKDNNLINPGIPSRGPGPVRDLRTSLSNNHQNNNIRHHPYQNNPNPPRPLQPFNNNPPPMFGQGPPQDQFHQHFDAPNHVNPNSTFDVHGGSTHSLTTAPNAPVIQQQPAAVYVGNLPETTCRNCLLYQLFAPYGAISSVKAMDVKNQREDVKSNWYGFVNYKDVNCANVAILTLDKSTLDGQTLKVVMKTDKSGPRGDRRGQQGGFRNNFPG